MEVIFLRSYPPKSDQGILRFGIPVEKRVDRLRAISVGEYCLTAGMPGDREAMKSR